MSGRRTARRRDAQPRNTPRSNVPRSKVRRLGRWLSLLMAVAVVAIAGARLSLDRFDSATDSAAVAEPAEVEHTPVPGASLVAVERIIDGDTLVVSVDGNAITVRLYGVDTPERGEVCYAEATNRLDSLAGTHVQLLPDARDLDRNGRWLRYVYTTDALLIDQALVAEGYGYAWRDDGSLRRTIIAAEVTAESNRIGCLWGS